MTGGDAPGAERAVTIDVRGVRLDADLAVPDGAVGIVAFAHGSGSGRRSPRNRAVAAELRRQGLATLLLDLLTAQEEVDDARTGHLRFDIPLLAGRLAGALDALAAEPSIAGLPAGCFGASTGGGAAMVLAARRPDQVAAVVSRGGRPDLAGDDLHRVRAPTLLLVGGADPVVLDLNRRALARLGGPAELVVVPGATHLFAEPGALEEVARRAGDWFVRHLGAAPGD
jgi:dienelactone hydrolase